LTISSIVRPVYFLPPAPIASPEESLWESVKNEVTPELLDLYLKMYPGGFHAAEARSKADALHSTADTARTEAADDFYWEAVRESKSTESIDAYLRRFTAGRHIAAAQRLLTDLRAVGTTAHPADGTDDATLRGVVDLYARAYSSFDAAALRDVFPSVSERQISAIRNLKKTCRSYQVRIGETRIVRGGPDAVLIEAQTEYDCRPATEEPNFVTMMTDLFRLHRTSAEHWVIETVSFLER
jgi:hypothetical protein